MRTGADDNLMSGSSLTSATTEYAVTISGEENQVNGSDSVIVGGFHNGAGVAGKVLGGADCGASNEAVVLGGFKNASAVGFSVVPIHTAVPQN
jgi:hypothetical protein